MTKSGSIVVEQALHGYTQGHSLIGTSVSLTSEAKRIMLPISDMSGARMTGGFEEYITGYPVKEMSLFAIAKTWYANEMKRPGCVWTHTLMIQFTDLPKVTNLDGLMALFRRPEGPGDIQGYDIRLTWERPQVEPLSSQGWLNSFEPSFIKQILWQLYASPTEGLLVKSPSTDKFDKLLLTLWQQQWPRLRRSFSFSSGSIEPRSINRRPLDIQVVPTRTTIQGSSLGVVNSMGSVTDPSTQTFPDWVDLAFNDLCAPSLLRDFFNNFGADVSPEPILFHLLAEAFLFFNESKESIKKALSFLSEKFPNPTEAANLKASILEVAKEGARYFLPKYAEEDILFALATTKNSASFDYDKIDFTQRFVRLFLSNQKLSVQVLNEIIADEPNVQGELGMKAIADLISIENVDGISWKFSNLVSVLLSLNPAIAYNPAFWRQNARTESEIVHFLLRNVEMDGIYWNRILDILLTTGSAIIPRILEPSIPGLPSAILTWCNGDRSRSLEGHWITYLENNANSVLDWFKSADRPSEFVVELCISLLDPNSSVVIKGGHEPWYRLIVEPGLVEDGIAKNDLQSFALALAFNFNGLGAVLLFQACFETAYVLLLKESMHFQLWNALEIHTKTLPRFQNWDKCKRLVRALVDEAITKGYDIKAITDTFNNRDIRDRVMRRYRKLT
jgi:hypothetical protein